MELEVFQADEDIPSFVKGEYAKLLGSKREDVPPLCYDIMCFFESLADSTFPQGVKQLPARHLTLYPDKLAAMQASLGADFDPHIMLRTEPLPEVRELVALAGPMFAAGVQLGAKVYGHTPKNLVYTNDYMGRYIGYVRPIPGEPAAADHPHANTLLLSVPKLSEVALDLIIQKKMREKGIEIPLEQTKCYDYTKEGFEEMVHCMQATDQARSAQMIAQDKDLYRMDSPNDKVRGILAETGYAGANHPHPIRNAVRDRCNSDPELRRWFTQTDPRESDADREIAMHHDEIKEAADQLLKNLTQISGPPL